MIFKNRRRIIIVLVSLFILLLYFSRNLSIIIPFIITIVALLLFRYIDRSFNFRFPEIYYIYIFIIFGLGPIVGEGRPPFGFYYRGIVYDKLLHFLSPIMMSAIIFYILNRLVIPLKWKLVMTVGIVFGILGLFEIGEYLSDVLFGTLHQGVYLKDFARAVKYDVVIAPIHDTMQDLIFGLLGSIVFVFGKFLDIRRELNTS